MDVKTAFLHADGFVREIYMKPPKETCDPTSLWKLFAAAYGLVNNGCLWFRTSDNASVNDPFLEKSRHEHTLYFNKKDGDLFLILVAQVDNCIYAGTDI